MPVSFRDEGHICSNCNKEFEEVIKSKEYAHYNDASQRILCKNCAEKHENIYKEICPKCKKPAHEHGGMSTYDKAPNKPKKMCSNCVDDEKNKKKKRDAKKLKNKIFIKEYGLHLITITIAIIALLHSIINN